MRYQTVTAIRKAGFRVKLDPNGQTGTARKAGFHYRIIRDTQYGWLFTGYGWTRGEVA
jgi:hypothetical protein